MNYKLNEIVLVADSFTHSEESINFYSTTLEKPSIEYTNDVYNALKLYAKKVKICNSPNDLNKYLLNNTVDLVMTIYGGEISRNRLALVPAICESMDVKYLGADVYNRIICQDKHLAKVFAKKFNVLSAKSILLHTKDDLYLINSLNFPLVIKPNYEGSSIGISNKNIVYNMEETKIVVYELLEIFKQPLLVEEFIGGKEVNITIVGDNKNIDIFEVVEDIHIKDSNFFDTNLYTLEHKQLNCENFSHKIITDDFSSEIKQNIINMYKSMGKIDYIRVDGKIYKNQFYLIELTPDPYCAIGSSFIKGILSKGFNYEQAIALLVNNSLKYYQTLYSNETIHK